MIQRRTAQAKHVWSKNTSFILMLRDVSLTYHLSSSLVLIHGLNGDRIQSFTHPQSKVFWPKDLLPDKQPFTRVLSFGYEANIYGNTSLAGIRGNARMLLSRLSDHRNGVSDDRPIVFLAHSLGGLILKDVRDLSFLQIKIATDHYAGPSSSEQ